MKRLLTVILCASLVLSACAAGASGGTPDEAAAATPDTAVGTTNEKPTESPTEAPTDPPTEAPTDPPTVEELAQARYEEILAGELSCDKASVSVPAVYQSPELPTGCEAVALTIAIRAYGYELNKTDIASKYLVYGDDYITSFVGSPFKWGGAGIYPPGLVKTVENYVKDTGAQLCPIDSTDVSLDDLYKFIDNGIPVVVWTTYYMSYPRLENSRTYQGHTYSWYINEHCVCLYGYDKKDGTVKISDPQRGKIDVSAKDFANIYDTIGRMSMVMIPTGNLS